MGNNEIKVAKAVCCMCHARCRVDVHSREGRLIKIAPDRTFPKQNRVAPPIEACLRMRGVKEWFYHPDRVNYPLKRAGRRGEGKWQKVSWEQALNEVAENLAIVKDKYGPEGIAVTGGTGRTNAESVARFVNLLGSPNHISSANVCHTPVAAVACAMLGWTVRHRTMASVTTGQSGTKCAFLIGINPAQAVPPLWKSVLDGHKDGMKLIVVDPRRTEAASLADLWLQLRPGTDTALLMSMINVVIEEGLYDKEFVGKWCYGFNEVANRVRDYPPEKVAEITWVPAEAIREAARTFAYSKPAMAVHGMGIEHLSDSIYAIQARFILCAITGNVDVQGSDFMTGPSRAIPLAEFSAERLLSQEQKMKQIGADRFKLLTWPGRDLMEKSIKKTWGQENGIAPSKATAHEPTVYQAMISGKPYPVRAAITSNSNPLITRPNVKMVYEALKSLDFYVVIDFWKTPSAEISDYILPTTTWLERPFLRDNTGEDCELYGGEAALPASIEGEYDHKTDYEIYRELGIRLGQKECWPWKNMEEMFTYRLKPLGVTFEEFMAKGGYDFPTPVYKKYERMGFGTPTGKLELYSTIFEKLGCDPLPKFQENYENPVSRPDLAKDYPLMLITGGRFHPMFHSEYFNVDSARKHHPHPLLQINPEAAKKLDIADGDWVWVETLRGRVRLKAKHFTGIDPRVVHAEHGWWFPELPGEEPWLHGVWESNINVVTDNDPNHCDKLSGGWPLKTNLCKVYKVKSY